MRRNEFSYLLFCSLSLVVVYIVLSLHDSLHLIERNEQEEKKKKKLNCMLVAVQNIER